jgi:hemin uptake protein HemP
MGGANVGKAQYPTKPIPSDTVPSPAVRVLHAAELFQGNREVCIDLNGVRYRLRITRRNKLILQK